MPPTPRSATTEGLTGEKEAGTGGRAQGGNLCNVPSPKGGGPSNGQRARRRATREATNRVFSLWILTSNCLRAFRLPSLSPARSRARASVHRGGGGCSSKVGPSPAPAKGGWETQYLDAIDPLLRADVEAAAAEAAKPLPEF